MTHRHNRPPPRTAFESLESRRLFALAGDIDLAFGANGVAAMDLVSKHAQDHVVALIPQSGGKFVAVVAVTHSGAEYSGFIRYNADGSVDKTFGTNGVTTRQHSYFQPLDAVAQSDGRVVVLGIGSLDDHEGETEVRGLMLYRVMPDGTFDDTFGTNGVAWRPELKVGFGTKLAVQGDDKIVTVARGSGSRPVAVRFNANGTVDANFGVNGVADSGAPESAFATGIAVTTDGKIVIADQFRLTRFNTDGSLDTTFGAGGFAGGQQVDGRSSFGAVRAAPGGGFYVFANHVGPRVLARYTAAGQLDTTFGDGGSTSLWIGGNYVSPQNLRVDALGRIVVGGIVSVPSAADNLAVARFNPDGTPDATFGAGGLSNYSYAAYGTETANDVLVTDAGDVIAGGTLNTTGYYWAAVYKFRGSGTTREPRVTLNYNTLDVHLTDAPDVVHARTISSTHFELTINGKTTTYRNDVALQLRLFTYGGADVVDLRELNFQTGANYGMPRGVTLEGGAGNDVLVGHKGPDRILGGDGLDRIHGWDGEDHLSGNAQADRLDGGNGNDHVLGNGGRDRLAGGDDDGADHLEGGDQPDTLFGGAGQDRLVGGGSHDRLYGGDGADEFFGGGGDDLFFARDAFTDHFVGGTGNDLAQYDAEDQMDYWITMEGSIP